MSWVRHRAPWAYSQLSQRLCRRVRGGRSMASRDVLPRIQASSNWCESCFREHKSQAYMKCRGLQGSRFARARQDLAAKAGPTSRTQHTCPTPRDQDFRVRQRPWHCRHFIELREAVMPKSRSASWPSKSGDNENRSASHFWRLPTGALPDGTFEATTDHRKV